MTTATVEQMDTTETTDIVQRAQAIAIVDGGSYTQAGELLRTVKAFQSDVTHYYKPRKEQAKAVHQQYCDDERDRLAPLLRAEAALKQGMKSFDDQQELLRQAEQRRLEEEARRRAEARQLEEAAALEMEGNAANDPELLYQANELLTQPVETPLVTLAKATPKVAGVTYRETWKGECVDLMRLVRHIAEHPEHVNLLQANTTAINQLARAQKSGLKLPGLRVLMDRDIAAGRR
jgi:hypothetical protein